MCRVVCGVGRVSPPPGAARGRAVSRLSSLSLAAHESSVRNRHYELRWDPRPTSGPSRVGIAGDTLVPSCFLCLAWLLAP